MKHTLRADERFEVLTKKVVMATKEEWQDRMREVCNGWSKELRDLRGRLMNMHGYDEGGYVDTLETISDALAEWDFAGNMSGASIRRFLEKQRAKDEYLNAIAERRTKRYMANQEWKGQQRKKA